MTLFFYPIWLAVWAFIVVGLIPLLFSSDVHPSLFGVVWLTGWIVAGLFILFAFLWSLFGNEIIRYQNGCLTVRRALFGFGPASRYSRSKISNLRISAFSPQLMSVTLSLARLGMAGGNVVFDYDGRTERLGIDLSESDSHELVRLMKQKFNLD